MFLCFLLCIGREVGSCDNGFAKVLRWALSNHTPRHEDILAWNCRGIGRVLTVRTLKALNQESNPDVVFITESKSKAPRIEAIKSKLGFVDSFVLRQKVKQVA